MKISPIDSAHIEKFYKLSEQYSDVFSCKAWHSIHGNNLTLYGIFDNAEELVGGFHLFRSKVGPFNYFRNPLFTPHIGFFYANTGQHQVNRASQLKAVLEEMTVLIKKLPYQVISFSFNPGIVDMQPFSWADFKVIPYYTYELDLAKTEDELFAGLAGDRRNDMKKAQKDGITVSETKDFKLIHDLVKKTFERQSKALDFGMVNKILNEFATIDNSFAYVAYRDNVPIAGTFCLVSGSRVYYLLGGYDAKNRHKGAGALTLWEAILHAKRTGANIFDFEGSMVPAIEKYFRGFGGNIVPYFTVNKANFLLEILLKFKKRQVF
jgi:lipid II:glycine glycyltransferase (peptidoglycan interpeptide bridge formation enzyme)